jgi:hypothetical protein
VNASTTANTQNGDRHSRHIEKSSLSFRSEWFMTGTNTLGVRIATIGLALTFLAGCAQNAVPGQQPGSSSSQASRAKQAAACPASGIEVGPGDSGTFSVGNGDSCDLFGPEDQTCLLDSLAGYQYTFVIQSGAGHGTLSGTTQTGSGSEATFHRTGAGNVVIYLKQLYQNPVNECKPGGDSTYGSVTLD